MNTSCLEHCLSNSQRAEFEERGYLLVENAVSADRTNRLIELSDRLQKEKQKNEGLPPHGAYSEPDIISRDSVVLEMIDCETIFPKVWGILGWNIHLYHSHLDVTPPSDPNRNSGDAIVAWHQDSMRVNDEIESSPRPRLSLKVGYFLTDVSAQGRGNTLVVPGSQLRDEIDIPLDGFTSPPDAIPICATKGSAIVLDRRTWHSRSLNESEFTRRVLWMGYSYRWLRPKDQMTVESLYPELDPIQRQILGDCPTNNGCYAPEDEDVPLRVWLRQHCPADEARTLHGRRQSSRPDIARDSA
jgi:ectoine hydroxylase